MAQSIFADINPNIESGNQLAQDLNDFKEALMTTCSGTSRPAEILEGGIWLDTTSDPVWVLKMYDGTTDIELFTIDTSSASSSTPGAVDSFQIAHTSADTVAPILEMLKARIANNGQVLGADYIGEIKFRGNANDLSVLTTARIRAIATQNYTASTGGTDLVFEVASSGSVTPTEVLRIHNAKLGVGVTSPDEVIHALGNIKAAYTADDTNPSKVIMRKKKATGTGQTLSGETFGRVEFNSTDEGSGEVLAAKVEAVALENHSTTAQGTKLSVSTKSALSTSFTERFVLGVNNESKSDTIFSKTIALLEQVDSSTTGAAQSLTPTGSVLKVTNASLTSINNIASPTDGKVIVLINGTGNPLTLTNDSGGTAANRIKTGSGADLIMNANTAVPLVYDAGASRWQVVGGSGGSSSGGGGSLEWQENVGNAPTATIESFVSSYLYASAQAQELYALVKVPNSYTSGRQISMKMSFYSPDSTGNALLQTVTTLIRKTTDVITSTTNQRTSTNSAVTLGGGTVNIPQEVTFDLTSSTGQINAVAVSAGDLIIVKLTRGTDTATSDLRALVFGAEVVVV